MQLEIVAAAVLASLLGGVTALLTSRLVTSVRKVDERRRAAVTPEEVERAAAALEALEKARAEYQALDADVRGQAERVRNSMARPGQPRRALSRP